jgi:hypothetical protein
LLLLQSWMMEVSMLGIYSIMILRSMRTALRVKQCLFLPNLFNFFYFKLIFLFFYIILI